MRTVDDTYLARCVRSAPFLDGPAASVVRELAEECLRLRALSAALVLAAKNVPNVRRGECPPFSLCLGCDAEDGDRCRPGCWVAQLGRAIHDAEDAP